MAITTVSDISSSLLSQLGSVQATTSATGVLNIIQTARRAYEERNAPRQSVDVALQILRGDRVGPAGRDLHAQALGGARD